MSLKSQIILVAVLFIVFAALSGIARARSAALAQRRRRRRRRLPSTEEGGDDAPLPTLVDDPEPAEDRPGFMSPPLLVVAIGILLAAGAAVAVILLG